MDWGTFLGLPLIDGEKSTVTATISGSRRHHRPGRARASGQPPALSS